MINLFIKKFEERKFPLTKNHPPFRPGDTLCVHYKVEESGKAADDGAKKYRIQLFEGVCIRFRKGGAGSTFTVRKIGANSIGVERTFPFHSPLVDKIDLVAAGVVRRSRLYYLRDLLGKAARIRTRRLPEGTIMSSVNKA